MENSKFPTARALLGVFKHTPLERCSCRPTLLIQGQALDEYRDESFIDIFDERFVRYEA